MRSTFTWRVCHERPVSPLPLKLEALAPPPAMFGQSAHCLLKCPLQMKWRPGPRGGRAGLQPHSLAQAQREWGLRFPTCSLGRQPLLPGRLRGIACGSLCGVSNTMCMCWAVLRCFSRVRLVATLWTIARQAPLSMQFSRQGYWSGLPCPPPRNLSDPGIKLVSLVSPALAGGFLTTWGAQCVHN